MEPVVRNVGDIQSGERRWLESQIGKPLDDHQQLFIMVISPDVTPDGVTRNQAMAEIGEMLDKADANAKDRGIAREEADRLVDEAVRHVRSHRR